MTAKNARVYTLDELKEKCQKALADPRLVEIVKTAPLNKDGKINLSWVYREAEKYVHGETKDLQKTKELAVEARFLAMLRRDYAEELLFSSQGQEKETQVQEIKHETFDEKEFELPYFTTIITRTHMGYSMQGGSYVSNSIKFTADSAVNFCLTILNSFTESYHYNWSEKTAEYKLKKYLIQLLEEKLCLKVKVCGNCDRCMFNPPNTWTCICSHEHHPSIYDKFDSCEYWTLKKLL